MSLTKVEVVPDEEYRIANGENVVYTVKREYGNYYADGSPVRFAGRWVARKSNGEYITHGKYRNDVFDYVEAL